MMLWMPAVLWTALGFFLGSLPFSVWVGKLAIHADLRGLGDGNPGSANAWRLGGWRVGLPVLALDFLKAALPVGIAHQVGGIAGWNLVPVALAPILGHAWSPFLGFRGGKAVDATFGAWTGLTLWQGPTLLGIILGITYGTQENDGWSVALGMTVFFVCIQIAYDDPVLSSIAAANLLVLAWTHRRDLRNLPRPRAWVVRALGRVH
jgi:glycerol-3-phosphate acyltransferase PlsY